MNTNEELRQQMWELAYGLLSPEEVASLHARIKSDPVAARLYAEVRLQADLVADAAKVSDPSVQFHVEGEPSLIRPAPAKRVAASGAAAKTSSSKGVNWLVGLTGMALAALLCLALFRPATNSSLLAERLVATSVEAPARWQSGVSQEVAVYTTDIDQVGKPAEVEVRLVDATGEERLRRSVRTDERGRGSVDLLCESLAGPVRLEVTARAEELAAAKSQLAAAKAPVVVEVEAIPEPVEAYMMVDKPAYQAGETVNYAVRKVTRFSKRPVSDASLSAEGKALESERQVDLLAAAPVGEVVEAGQIQLPASGAFGRLASDPQGNLDKELAERDAVGRFYYFDQVASALPRLNKQQMDGAEVAAEMRFGKPAPADLARADNAPARTRGGMDAGRPGQSPSADAVKANGGAALEADDALAKAPSGRAGASARGIASRQNVVAAGQPIEVALPTGLGRQLLVTARCNDRVVASKEVTMALDPRSSRAKQADEDVAAAGDAAPGQRGALIAELNPPPEIDGEILVSIYDNQQQPPQLIARQHFFRQPQQRLEVRLPDLKDHYAAGQRVKLQVQVVDEQARPVDASLAVRVWNERLVQAAGAPVADLASAVLSNKDDSLANAEANLGLAALSYGAGRLRGLSEQAAASGGAEADGAAATKPHASGSQALRADLGALYGASESESLLAGVQPVRLEASNFVEVKAAYESAAARARRQAAERKATIGRLLLIGGLALLALLGMQALLRASAKASVWLPSVAIAAASLALGAVWLNPRFEAGEAVQTAALPAEASPELASEAAPADDAAVFQAPEANEPAPASTPSPAANPEVYERFLEREQPGASANDASATSPRTRGPAAMESLEQKEAGRFDAQAGKRPAADASDLPAAPAPTAPPPAPEAASPADAPADVPRLKSALPSNEPSVSGRDEAAGTPPADRTAPARVLGDRARRARPAEPAGRAMRRSTTGAVAPFEEDGKNAAAEVADEPIPRPAAAPAVAQQQAEVRGGAAGAAPAAPMPAPGMRRSAGATAGSEDKLDRFADQQPPAEKSDVDAVAAKKLGKAVELEGAEREEAMKSEAEFRQNHALKQSEGKDGVRDSTVAPASLLFEPALPTDSSGRATIEFTLPEVDCEYRVVIDAIGHGRIGSVQQVIVGRTSAKSDE